MIASFSFPMASKGGRKSGEKGKKKRRVSAAACLFRSIVGQKKEIKGEKRGGETAALDTFNFLTSEPRR